MYRNRLGLLFRMFLLRYIVGVIVVVHYYYRVWTFGKKGFGADPPILACRTPSKDDGNASSRSIDADSIHQFLVTVCIIDIHHIKRNKGCLSRCGIVVQFQGSSVAAPIRRKIVKACFFFESLEYNCDPEVTERRHPSA